MKGKEELNCPQPTSYRLASQRELDCCKAPWKLLVTMFKATSTWQCQGSDPSSSPHCARQGATASSTKKAQGQILR